MSAANLIPLGQLPWLYKIILVAAHCCFPLLWSIYTSGASVLLWITRFDLVIAGDPNMASKISPVCTVGPEDVDPEALRDPMTRQQCFFFPFPDLSESHYGFFGINQVRYSTNSLSCSDAGRLTPTILTAAFASIGVN